MCGFVGDAKDGVHQNLRFLPDWIEALVSQWKTSGELYDTRLKTRSWIDMCGATNTAQSVRCSNCEQGWRPQGLLCVSEIKGPMTCGWICLKCSGKNTEPDVTRCFHCKELCPSWWAAAKAHQPPSASTLIQCPSTRESKAKDKPTAQELFDQGKSIRSIQPVAGTKLIQQAAIMGLPAAQLEYAESLLVGRGVDADCDEAMKWFYRAADHKDAVVAKHRLGYVLQDPTTTNNEPMKAVPFLKEAAQAGNTEAAFLLGQLCLEGRGMERSIIKAAEWFEKAPVNVHFACVAAFDRLGEYKKSLQVLEIAANANNSYAQLQLAWRHLLGDKHLPKDAVKARNYLTQASKDKIRPTDPDPAVLIAKALLANDYESLPQDKQMTLLRAGVDFEGPIDIGTNHAGQRTVECTMVLREPLEKQRVTLVVVEPTEETITRHVTECISLPCAEDPSQQPLGVTLYVDLLDMETGLREKIRFALITRPVAEENKQATVPETKEPSAESQRILIMRGGHHTNNWLAVLGDIDKIMPTLLKYLNRDWKVR